MAIAFENVDYSYNGVNSCNSSPKILDHFSLTLPEQGVLCLYGPSGCGKTTLLRLLAGLEQPQSGRIAGLNGLKKAVVFQENRLLPWCTALENVVIAANTSRQTAQAAKKEAAQRLALFGLGDMLNKYPNELSGGMKRRVAIARALAEPAGLLLLDEPFEGLEPALWTILTDEIHKAYADKPVILVTHIADQAAVMHADTVCLNGPPLQIKTNI